MARRRPQYRVIRVTMTTDYLVEMLPDGERSAINGSTPEELIQEWFHGYPLAGSHATRDVHRVGNSTRFLSAEVMTVDQATGET